MSAPELPAADHRVICEQLQRHWRMCRALRHHSQPAARKAAASYFRARRAIAEPGIERKALKFVPIPEQAPA